MNPEAILSHSALGQEASLPRQLAGIGPPAHPGQVGTLDGWELVSLIGQGGMGLVFLGRAPQSDPQVAIKILRPELAESARAKAYFLKEANHMRQLDHPHILPVLEFKELEDSAYLVMPYMRQRSLKQRLVENPRQDPSQVVKILLQVAGALCYAHQHGIIHRDVKPSNILLDDEGKAHLTDFGLSRSLYNDVLTDVHQATWEGTASYLSPQTAQGLQDDTRGDIYSLGAVLYELLTGQPPYLGSSREEITRHIRAGPPEAIRERNPQASEALVQIADKAMARELKDRYAHISYMVEDLEAIQQGGNPIHATPTLEAGQTLQKQSPGTMRRRGLTVAGLVLVIVLGGYLWWTMYANPLQLVRTITLPGVWNWSKAILSQVSPKGTPKLFVTYENTLFILSSDGHLDGRWEVPVPNANAFSLLLRANVNSDPILETLVSYQAGSDVYISTLNDTPHAIKSLQFPGATITENSQLKGDTGVREAAWIDLLGNQKPSLLGIVGTGFQKQPRGLYSFNLESSQVEWQYPTGPHLTGLEFLDLDDDGRLEIICGSDAADNTNIVNGTSDLVSYLFAFKADGQSLWTTELGDRLTLAHPLTADLDGDGRKDIIAWLESRFDLRPAEKLPEVGRVYRLDPQGNITARYDNPGTSLYSCRTSDLDGDGRPEILATDVKGRLLRLNAALETNKTIQIVPPSRFPILLELWAVADVNGDQRPELVFHSSQQEFVSGTNPGRLSEPRSIRFYHQIELLVFSQDFKLLARHTIAKKTEGSIHHSVMVADMDSDSRNEIVYCGDEVRILRWKY